MSAARRNESAAAARLDVCTEFRDMQQLSRRAVLRAGGLAAIGLSLPAFLRSQAQAGAPSTVAAAGSTAPGFGRAKRCIFLFMWGGPSQLDTFDMKPEAPDEVRGEFKPIANRLPGLQLCEHFEMLAGLTDRLAVIRSLHHTDPAHLSSGHATLTGNWAPVLNSDAEPPSRRDSPHIGSVLARVRHENGQLPNFVTVPWMAYHPSAPGGRAPGQHAGWLGTDVDPFLVTGDPNTDGWQVPELALGGDLTVPRLDGRRQLLSALDRTRASMDEAAALAMSGFKQQAMGLLSSPAAREAFDLAAEPDAVRERYGRNIHGQCVLLARRLVEHGVPLVSVNWHNDGKNFWDTHGNNFRRLKRDLIPPADRALSALLMDLEERGMLDDTIVAWVGEFGRKPQIDRGNNAGRDHWPGCYSGLLAGGGIHRGAIYGTSDAHAAAPALDPVSPLDYAATVYHALGISPEDTLDDSLGRPRRVCEGRPLLELFS